MLVPIYECIHNAKPVFNNPNMTHTDIWLVRKDESFHAVQRFMAGNLNCLLNITVLNIMGNPWCFQACNDAHIVLSQIKGLYEQDTYATPSQSSGTANSVHTKTRSDIGVFAFLHVNMYKSVFISVYLSMSLKTSKFDESIFFAESGSCIYVFNWHKHVNKGTEFSSSTINIHVYLILTEPHFILALHLCFNPGFKKF